MTGQPEPVRVQTGVRMDKRTVKVLKAVAEYYDLYLGDLLEDIVQSTFAGRKPFSVAALSTIRDLMRIYEEPTAARADSPRAGAEAAS
jgi:hypothetical protein